MIRRITGILITLCLLLPTAGHAQAPGDSDTEETPSTATTAEEQRSEPEQDTADAETPAPPAESFSPTEEISEDLSVPFPVDI